MKQPGVTGPAARYIRFAEREASGRSPLYEALARGVAANADALRFLATLPPQKQQPNLLFAAMRHLFGVPADWQHFLRNLMADPEAVRAVMLARATQTNEPARCATLLPVLARLPQPLALLEVGASAGLCLLPDLYGYDFPGQTILPEQMDAPPPVFACAADRATPIPRTMPRIVWRAGLDLNPLDARDPDHTGWLEALVWPEQTHRLANLRAALRIAAKCQPRIVRADLLSDGLVQLCHDAPRDATLVIFHTAVLAYVADRVARRAFVDRVRSLCPYWIANESPRGFPEGGDGNECGDTSGRFLLSVNGLPAAWTDPHGAAMEWIENA